MSPQLTKLVLLRRLMSHRRRPLHDISFKYLVLIKLIKMEDLLLSIPLWKSFLLTLKSPRRLPPEVQILLVLLRISAQKFTKQSQQSIGGNFPWILRCKGITVNLKCRQLTRVACSLQIKTSSRSKCHTRMPSRAEDSDYQKGSKDWRKRGTVGPSVGK